MTEVTLRIELFPEDMDRFVDFYTRVLRFRLVRDERDAAFPYVAVQRGSVHIGASKAWEQSNAQHRRPPAGVEIVLELDDLEAEERSVAGAGWALERPITLQPWGARDFRLLDPDGYFLRITTR